LGQSARCAAPRARGGPAVRRRAPARAAWCAKLRRARSRRRAKRSCGVPKSTRAQQRQRPRERAARPMRRRRQARRAAQTVSCRAAQCGPRR
jgi:hypothetical protein